jgi:photosystem II stability/assembly factor-like uncharacterized protein
MLYNGMVRGGGYLDAPEALAVGQVYGEYMNERIAIAIVIALVLGGCSLSNESEISNTTIPMQVKLEIPSEWTATPSLQEMKPTNNSGLIISPTMTFLPTLNSTFRPAPTTTSATVNKNPCQVSNPDENSDSNNYSKKGQTIIKMVSSLIGWRVDPTGEILRTTDGGYNWKSVNHPKDNDEIYFVTSGCGPFFFVLDADHAWDLPKWHTSDGGSTWHKANSIPTYHDFGDFLGTFVDYDFIDSQTGWMLWDDCCSDGKHSINPGMFITRNGGDTWENGRGGLDLIYFKGLVFISKSIGFAGGVDANSTASWKQPPIEDSLTGILTPAIYKTVDGGYHWQKVHLPKLPISPITNFPVDSATQFCNISALYRTLPNGVWVRVYCDRKYKTNENSIIEKIKAIPQSFSYYSPNGGNSWDVWVSDTDETFINQTTGWRLYSPAPNAPHMLQHTTDGGYTWKTTSTVEWQKVQFNFLNDKTGFALATVGDLTSLLRTDDGGMTWHEIKMSNAEKS